MDARRPFRDHLQELRNRLFIWLVLFLIGSTIGYFLHPWILTWFNRPLHQALYYTSPIGGFTFTLKLALLFGFLVSFPVLLYQIFSYTKPLLNPQFQKRIAAYICLSIVLLGCGVAFAYFLTLPAALKFLSSFSTDGVRALISTDEYYSFTLFYLLGFGLIFQLPLILLFINAIHPLDPLQLLKKQGSVILVSFIVAAFLTPTPDPINQTLMALPIILLYNLGILILWQGKRLHLAARPLH